MQVTFIHPCGSDELTEMQLLMSTSCQARQPGNPILLYVEKPFLFSDLAAKAAKSENKKGFSTSETACISSWVNKFN